MVTRVFPSSVPCCNRFAAALDLNFYVLLLHSGLFVGACRASPPRRLPSPAHGLPRRHLPLCTRTRTRTRANSAVGQFIGRCSSSRFESDIMKVGRGSAPRQILQNGNRKTRAKRGSGRVWAPSSLQGHITTEQGSRYRYCNISSEVGLQS